MSQKKRKEDGFILDHDKGKSLKNQMLLLKIPSAHALSLSFEDYKNPENVIISNLQRQHFKKEFALLEKRVQQMKLSVKIGSYH